MKIALCYENVVPARGGCETYIASLARRLAVDGHQVHLYASRWDAAALPASLHCHPIPRVRSPRFLRPWRFGAACAKALKNSDHDVSLGFDKTWGQDVLYPQGGLHLASAAHNLRKYDRPFMRQLVALGKDLDPAHWSFALLERKQYLGASKPLIVVNSHMVAQHFQHYYQMSTAHVRVVRAAIDLDRFPEHDRPQSRYHWRLHWGLGPKETVALFAAMNYRLKGLEPLLHAIAQLPKDQPFRLLVVGNPKTRAYEALAARLGVAHRVCFAGFCAETRNAYFAADYLVHPTFYDPCSLVVLEALACGLPVVTSAYNGAAELMQPPREGYVVTDPHDHAQLAWCMSRFFDPAHRAACAQAARKTASQWTFEDHYQQLLSVMVEASARRQQAA